VAPVALVVLPIALLFALLGAAPAVAQDTGPRQLSGHAGEILCLAFSPTERALASGSADSTIRVWEQDTGRELRLLTGHTGPVHALAFSRDGRVLVSGSGDGTLRVWDLATGRQIRASPSPAGAIRGVAFAPDGAQIAVADDRGSIRLVEAASGKELRAAQGPFGRLLVVVYAPDGRTLATGGADGVARVRDVASLRELHALSGHTGAVHALAFSRDGALLATAGADRTVRLWDAATGRERAVLSGHGGAVHAVAFTPDGRSAISAGADGSVRLWDVASGSERAALIGHAGPVNALAVSRDGGLVASGGRDRAVLLRPPAATLGTGLAEKMRRRGEETGPVPAQPPLAEAEVALRPSPAVAGGEVTISVRVTNKGKGPLYRLQARTRSDDAALDGHSLYFGKVDAGRSAEDDVTVRLPADRPDGQIALRLEFQELNGFAPAVQRAAVQVSGADRPRFAWSYQVIDDGTAQTVGNGDGRIQKGESVALAFTVQNTGSRAAAQASLEVTSSAQSGVAIADGKAELGALAAGETRVARARLTLPPSFAAAQIPLQLLIRDRASSAMRTEAIAVPVDARAAPAVVATNKIVTVIADPSAEVRGGAGADTPVIASAARNRAIEVTGVLGDWYRIRISETASGWIARRLVADASAAARDELTLPQVRAAAVVPVRQGAPPMIVVAAPADGEQVSADRVQLVGAIGATRGVASVEISVNGQSVSQTRARSGAAAPTQGENLQISERIPLREGQNEIVVTAMDRDNVQVKQVLTVTRAVDRGQIHVVAIGISTYRTVRPLLFADRDASAFADYMRQDVGVPAKNITLLLNDKATLTELKRVLGNDLRRKAAPADTVIIFYAGHGAPEPDAASQDGDGLEKYIVPWDGDASDLYTTALPMREMETIFGRLAADRVIFISDACYSGAAGGRTLAAANLRAVVSDSYLERVAKGKGRVVLTASGGGQTSAERSDLGHGVFTHFLLEGLRGKADFNGDGVVTVDEIFDYVSRKVPEATGQAQRPVRRGSAEGQLILGRTR